MLIGASTIYYTEKLSICIPTKDRPNKLRLTIEAFLDQIKEKSAKIYVSDNGSGEETFDMIRNIFGHNDQVLYFKNLNPEKSFQTNFLNLISKAKGKYLWFFGDDDLPETFALNKIFKVIDRYPDFIAIPYTGYDIELKNVLPNWKIKIEEDSEIFKRQFIKFLTDTSAFNGFISFIIMQRRYIVRALDFNILDKNSNYIQTFVWAVALLYLPEITCGIKIGKPLVKWRQDFGNTDRNKQWTKSRFLLGLEHRDIFLVLSIDLKNNILLTEYDGKFQLKLIYSAILWKSLNHYSLDDAIISSKSHSSFKIITKLAIILVSLLPNICINLLKEFIKTIITSFASR